MALPATLVVETRSGGADTSGGGFNSAATGTDRTLSNTPFKNGTNLTVDITTNTDVTPDGYTPDAVNDPGNTVNITAGVGWTVGVYVINSVVSGKWRLDRSPAAVGVTGGTWAMGGARATLTQAFMVSSNTAYVQSGTYTTAVGWALTNATAIRVYGYSGSRGDAPTGSGRPLIQATAGSITLFSATNSPGCIYAYLSFDGNANTTVVGFGGSPTRCSAFNLKSLACATGFGATGFQYTLCEANTCTTGFGSGCQAFNCYATGCTTGYSAGTSLSWCIAVGGTTGFSIASNGNLYNCSAYNMTTGFTWTTNGAAINCISSTCTTGFNVSGANSSVAVLILKCFTYTCSTQVNGTLGSQSSTTNLTADPFTNAAGGDFSLTPAAQALLAAIPGTYPGLSTTTGYLMAGAAQPLTAVGDSGGSIMVLAGSGDWNVPIFTG